MIRHIVFFSARDAADVNDIVDALSTYATIPGVKDFEVRRNSKVDRLANDVDVVLHACFDTQEDLDAYKAHPTYIAGTEIVRPLRELRVAADYVV